MTRHTDWLSCYAKWLTVKPPINLSTIS